MKCCCPSGNPEVCQFDKSLFGGKDVCSFDVPMYDTLLVKVKEPMKYLGHIDTHKVFRKFPEILRN